MPTTVKTFAIFACSLLLGVCAPRAEETDVEAEVRTILAEVPLIDELDEPNPS